MNNNIYIKEKVQNAVYNKIKKLIFEEDGIIYGGMVRDEYIAQYYKKKYNKYAKKLKNNPNFDKNQFWNTNFHPETAYRTLLAKDIDVSFADIEKTHDFINKLLQNEDLKKCEITTYLPSPYIPQIKIIKRIKIEIVIGKIPFIYKGVTIFIIIDITIPVNPLLYPPFNNIDLLCNAFIMTKDGKRISNNTGTIIDKYSEYDKSVISSKIIKDMLEFKTYICLNPSFYKNIKKINYNNHCMNIVKNMYSKKFPWIILNMPFDTCINNEITDNTCCICYNNIEKNEKICYTTYIINKNKYKSPPIHYDCMIKYLFSQINDVSKLFNIYQQIDVERYILNNEESFMFKCPYRNIIDFAKCRDIIKTVYKE